MTRTGDGDKAMSGTLPEPRLATTKRRSCRALPTFSSAVVAVLLLTGLGAATTAASASSPAYVVTATVGVGRYPQGVAVDPNTDTVYVANNQSNTVSVIDGNTDSVTATIGVGSGPSAISLDPSTDTIYVSNSGGDTVSVIDGATNKVVGTITIGSQPGAIAVDPNTDTVYIVGGWYSSTCWVIDGATDTVTATIGVGYNPEGVAVDPSTDTVYVANSGNTDVAQGTISVIDGVTNTVTATIGGVGQYPNAIAVNPSTDMLYTANPYGDNVSVIDGTTESVVDKIGLSGGPGSLAVDPTNDTIVVTGGSVWVIDGSTNSVSATLGLPNKDAVAPAVDPATDAIYVTEAGSAALAVIHQVVGTTTTLSSSVNPSTYGEPVTLSATVSPSDGGGTLSFSADGSPIASCGGEKLVEMRGSYQATCTTASLSVGHHALSASYSGDAGYLSSSGSLTQSVDPAPTTLSATPALASLSPFGLNLFNLSATLSSEVTKAGLAGQPVVFSAGSSVLCRAVTNASGTATCDALADPADVPALLGADGYQVAYPGSTDYLPSGTSARLVGT